MGAGFSTVGMGGYREAREGDQSEPCDGRFALEASI